MKKLTSIEIAMELVKVTVIATGILFNVALGLRGFEIFTTIMF